MVTIKSYTDIEQSKKLADILPLESADMFYADLLVDRKHQYISHYLETYGFKTFEDTKTQESAHLGFIPCWSLAALLSVLPQSITKYIESERCQKTFHLNLFRSYYYCCSYSFSPSISDSDDNNTLYCVGRDNWVDACVAMIEKLHEPNLL